MSHRPGGGRRTTLSVAALLVALVAAGCTSEDDAGRAGPTSTSPTSPTSDATPSEQASPAPVAVTRAPDGVAVAGGESPSDLVAAVSAALFASAEVVVVARAGEETATTAAAKAATGLGVPLLLDDADGEQAEPTGEPTTTGPSSRPPARTAFSEEVDRLGAEVVLAVGDGFGSLATRFPEVDVVTAAASAQAVERAQADLPAGARPAALTGTTVVVRSAAAAGNEPGRDASAVLAASTTATAAGAVVVTSPTADPRASSAAIRALKTAPSGSVLGVGAGFGDRDRLASRLAVAATGVELPGGGQTMFPGRALVALYGHPAGGALGVLGEQGPAASVARAKKVAATYDPVYEVPVVPTFEIIATVASGSAGKDRNYSNEWSVESLTPYVDAATKAGMYVVLDLQPGRADLVEQAAAYRSLLVRPNVGLAIDPEWALTSKQKPLQQIGSVSAGQVNAVVAWLADLTASEKLPQKLLVLHQFKTSMLRDETSLDVSRDELAVLIHADGQGGRSAKEGTWNAIVAAAPSGVHFGWKNFYDEDPQLASPAHSVQRTPKPLMISYQ